MEVKTWSWSTFPKDCQNKKFNTAIQQFMTDCNIVLTCNKGIMDPNYKITYKFAASDQPLAGKMQDWQINNPNALPPEAMTYCLIEAAQACR